MTEINGHGETFTKTTHGWRCNECGRDGAVIEHEPVVRLVQS